MIRGINPMAISPPDGTRGKRPAGMVMTYLPGKGKNITRVITINLNTKMKMIGCRAATAPQRCRSRCRARFPRLDNLGEIQRPAAVLARSKCINPLSNNQGRVNADPAFPASGLQRVTCHYYNLPPSPKNSTYRFVIEMSFSSGGGECQNPMAGENKKAGID
jgi:hypothetical protein